MEHGSPSEYRGKAHHTVTHPIVTEGASVTARPRRLARAKLKQAQAEFDCLQKIQKNTCTLFPRNWVIGVLAEITEARVAQQLQAGTRFPHVHDFTEICPVRSGIFLSTT